MESVQSEGCGCAAVLPAGAGRCTKHGLREHEKFQPGSAVIVVHHGGQGSGEDLPPRVPGSSRDMPQGWGSGSLDLLEGGEGGAGIQARVAKRSDSPGSRPAAGMDAVPDGDAEPALGAALPAMLAKPLLRDSPGKGAGKVCIDVAVHGGEVQPASRSAAIGAGAGGHRAEHPCLARSPGIHRHRLRVRGRRAATRGALAPSAIAGGRRHGPALSQHRSTPMPKRGQNTRGQTDVGYLPPQRRSAAAAGTERGSETESMLQEA